MQAMKDKISETEERAVTVSTMNEMSTMSTAIYIEALNESSITFVRDLSRWGWDIKGPGWEACSPTGEMRAFHIRDKKAAEQWRADEISECVALRIARASGQSL